jgi:uncharacterized protein YigA (DUF484 family)
MTFEDEFKILVGGYLGIQEMDEYILKEYVLKDIEEHIKKLISTHNENINYKEITEQLKSSLSLKRKLQDSLLTLRKIDGPFELEHMVKLRLEDMKR